MKCQVGAECNLEGKGEYKCEECGLIYCNSCTVLCEGECGCIDLPRIIKIPSKNKGSRK